MSVESTKEVMNRYFAANHDDVSMLADDVVFTIMATGQEHHSPEGVQGMLSYFYQVAFKATGETRNLVFSDSNAVWEGELVGEHIGEFAGIPATSKSVRVPLCVVYDIENDQIAKGRVYFEMPALMTQLGIKME